MDSKDLEYCAKKREECITRAKTLSLLDAIYAIHHFNLRERGYCNHLPEVGAHEVLEHFDQTAYYAALERVKALCREDFRECDKDGEFDERFSGLIARNPGFSKQTYLVEYNDWQYKISR
jgi:hypothetical protein